VISIEKALMSDRRMRALSSMDGEAFVKLENRFADVLAKESMERTQAGQRRKRAAGAGRKGVLPSVRHKLFFILFYLKAYPTQDVMGYLFGLSQPQVCERVNQLMPLLKRLLDVELPARHGRDLAQVLARLPEVKEVFIDGTERPISRPQHKGRRDRHYSGRRKRTAVKNVIVTAAGRVVLVTPTVAGRRHDKSEADRASIRLDSSFRLLGDSGFQGYEAGRATVCTPRKKPRERPLHWRHRRANRKLAKVRVVVEHALASVKRLGILSQPLRAKRATVADLAMLIGCGLHNYRTDLAVEARN
jgi:DDE superfamily endonuclease/Helix-turn-helix of DDE superfamily endonuclease